MTACSVAGRQGATYVTGTAAGMDPETFAESKLILLWGTNTLTSGHHLWKFVLAARKNGDIPTATAKLGRAMELAKESGNEGTAKLLGQVFEVDEHTGTARLRRDVAAADEMALDARSTRTARVRKEA